MIYHTYQLYFLRDRQETSPQPTMSGSSISVESFLSLLLLRGNDGELARERGMDRWRILPCKMQRYIGILVPRSTSAMSRVPKGGRTLAQAKGPPSVRNAVQFEVTPSNTINNSTILPASFSSMSTFRAVHTFTAPYHLNECTFNPAPPIIQYVLPAARSIREFTAA